MTFMERVFNEAFPDYPNFKMGVGLDLGDAIVTKIGTQGDRELLCLGDPANIAAKIIGSANEIVVTSRVYDELPEKYRNEFGAVSQQHGSQIRSLTKQGWKGLFDSVKEDFGVEWNEEASTKRVEKDIADRPLSQIECKEARVKINLDGLSLRNSRRANATTLYVDIDGFTRRVAQASSDEEKKDLIRLFHVIRQEFRDIVTRDYGDGVKIQHQGDRIQAIYHLPKDEACKVCERTVEAVLACQWSMEEVINPEVENRYGLWHVAAGIDYGQIVVSRLGKKGDLDVVCLGDSVYRAESIQSHSAGKESRVSAVVYGHLEEEAMISLLAKVDGHSEYSTRKTLATLRAKRAAEEIDNGKAASVSKSGVVIIGGGGDSRSLPNTRPWAWIED